MAAFRFIRSLLEPVALLLLVIALVMLREDFDAVVLVILLAATVLVGASLFLPSKSSAGWPVDLALILALLISFIHLPLLDLYIQFPQLRSLVGGFVWMGLASAGLIALLALDRSARFAWLIFPLLLAGQLLMSLRYLWMTPEPYIDVYLIQKLGVGALLHGTNPYAITFPNIYNAAVQYYPKQLVVNGVVQCGYFYLPLSLLFAIPGYLAGDVRYVHAISLTLAAALVGFSRPGRRAKLVAALVLFLPQTFHVIENAWLEPEMVLLLALMVFLIARSHARIALFVLFALLLSFKQYTILAFPLLALLARSRRELARGSLAFAIALAAVNLPFFLWNPRAFLHSTVAMYSGLLRTDSVNISAWLLLRFGIRLPMFVTAIIGLATATCVARWTRAKISAALAFVMLVSFLFSTQAFVNYYFFAAAALAISLLECDFPAAKSATSPQAGIYSAA